MIPADECHILAFRAGTYNETLAIPTLRPHFLCAWTNEIAAVKRVQSTVIPDGCVDLLWRDNRFTVVGPDASAARRVLRPGTILGLRFRPGAAEKWLGLPLDAIVGQEVSMFELWGKRAIEVAEELEAEPIAGNRLALFQELMADVAVAIRPPPAEASVMVRLLDTQTEGRVPVSALPDHLNMSERTLRRWSRRHFGYGPKTLDRILRLQRLKACAEVLPQGSLASLAIDAGYADQPHLSREVHALCGMTAREFVRQLVIDATLGDGKR
ncbi:AraC family transcriptional regulator [Phyllobacterium endophyticum]|uniref:AraC family transcriptional regulator n=2 Tax=Phyllobacterium endophyticum TaxID=1149773 RepID=A0A2P7ARG0_9HYPH|nr:AraC family transcriptional regulator [Phyllobacterium endophyticum]